MDQNEISIDATEVDTDTERRIYQDFQIKDFKYQSAGR